MKKKSTAGGYRIGAGRPSGSGKYGEPTCAIRIHVSLLPQVEALMLHKEKSKQNKLSSYQQYFDNIYIFSASSGETYPTIPLYETRVAAGSPSLVGDQVERHLDLNEHLIEKPAATFFVRVEGDSMINAGIHENDILIVDRSIPATNGKIVIAVLNNELTVKRLELKQNQARLLPENERYQPIEITKEMEFRIWGVVVHVIHSL